MHEAEWLAERFEQQSARLWAVAYRMLGSAGESDSALEEVSLRLSGGAPSSDLNLRRWLTMVVGGVCLERLKLRRASSCAPAETAGDQRDSEEDDAAPPDSVCLALLVVLDFLTPGQRLAFVLHDLFAVPFDEVAAVAGCTAAAAEQLAREARGRVRGTVSPRACVEFRDA